MSLLSRLFGASKDQAPAPATSEDYGGFTITPEPVPDGGQYRLGAVIEKDGKTHQLIRADVFRDRDGAVEAAILKARQVIDEQGDALFR